MTHFTFTDGSQVYDSRPFGPLISLLLLVHVLYYSIYAIKPLSFYMYFMQLDMKYGDTVDVFQQHPETACWPGMDMTKCEI